jgi:alpha-galactosidase
VRRRRKPLIHLPLRPPPRPTSRIPPPASTTRQFTCSINASLVAEAIDFLASSPLKAAGYNWILIDDCWTSCAKYSKDGNCLEPAPRDPTTGRITVDKVKFPNGFVPLTKRARDKGLRVGIYTSVGHRTCAGYTGSFGNEAVDAGKAV